MALINELNEDAEPLGEPPSFTNKPEEQVERSMDLPTRLRRFFTTCLKSQSGFSLAELMVAAGVTGTLALGTLQLADLQTRSKFSDDLISAQQSVDLLMKNRNACSNSLQGINVTALPQTIPNGLSTHGGVCNPAAVPPTPKNCGLLLSPGAAAIMARDENTVTIDPNYVVFGNTVMVGEIAVTNFREIQGRNERLSDGQTRQQVNTGADAIGYGIAEVRITLAVKDNRRALGEKIRHATKFVYAPVTIDPVTNQITDCNPPEDQGVLNADFELCESMGGSYDGNKCNASRDVLTSNVNVETCIKIGGSYNTTRRTCVPSWYACSCPGAGNFVTGFTQNNTPICKINGSLSCTARGF